MTASRIANVIAVSCWSNVCTPSSCVVSPLSLSSLSLLVWKMSAKSFLRDSLSGKCHPSIMEKRQTAIFLNQRLTLRVHLCFSRHPSLRVEAQLAGNRDGKANIKAMTRFAHATAAAQRAFLFLEGLIQLFPPSERKKMLRVVTASIVAQTVFHFNLRSKSFKEKNLLQNTSKKVRRGFNE